MILLRSFRLSIFQNLIICSDLFFLLNFCVFVDNQHWLRTCEALRTGSLFFIYDGDQWGSSWWSSVFLYIEDALIEGEIYQKFHLKIWIVGNSVLLHQKTADRLPMWIDLFVDFLYRFDYDYRYH